MEFNNMLIIKEVKYYDLINLNRITNILWQCGIDMAKKDNLHHWDNSYIKTFVIVLLLSFGKQRYLLFSNNKAVATFQVKKNRNVLYFEKLATLPEESGKGYGTYCLETIESLAKEKHCSSIEMEVYSLSKHALNFYGDKGYEPVRNDKSLKYDLIVMRKDI